MTDITRRQMLLTSAGVIGASLLANCQSTPNSNIPDNSVDTGKHIDRHALVARHNPTVKTADPFSALSVGNGTLCFTADVTGLQTLNVDYKQKFPLCTAATWGWHEIPRPASLQGIEYQYAEYDTYGRKVGYATARGQKELYNFLRENPHRLHLGRIGFLLKKSDGTIATSADISNIEQILDLWTGVNNSRFTFAGHSVNVETAVDPQKDLLAVRIHTDDAAFRDGTIAVLIAFPYGSPNIDMADWNSPDKHTTSIIPEETRAHFARTLDNTKYAIDISWNAGRITQRAAHEFVLTGTGSTLAFTVLFRNGAQSDTAPLPAAGTVINHSKSHWPNFWSQGGAVDFSDSNHPQAMELERRCILSQYNTALHCSGNMPPQETGLLFNSWYGKSHLEMHWWHGVHFAAWNRLPLFARSLDWYHQIMHVAKDTAVRQGYAGVRWPKMVGPDGVDNPSPIGPLLIWQQPHPIYYAELLYRANPNKDTLNKWKDIVFATADFMADYAHDDGQRFVLGPPLKTVPEFTDPTKTINPTFELTYWRFGLATALKWQTRLNLTPDPKWNNVLNKLAKPSQENGRYLMQEGMSDTYTKNNYEHPSMVGAFGMLPGNGIDLNIMRTTHKDVMVTWQWDKCWGWDFPMMAMTVARLGQLSTAADCLLIQTPKNLYHPNGHVFQRLNPKSAGENLTAYLPANGGLLAAIAMMANSKTPPGATSKRRIAKEGQWTLRSEKVSMLL